MSTHEPVVITITPNPARDVTITVDTFEPEATHRIDSAQRVLGGKGINVARVAAAQGYPSVMTGPVAVSDRDECDLGENLSAAFSDTAVGVRETFAIHTVSTNNTTIINERGAKHPDGVWDDVCASVARIATEHPGSVVTISGSWPPGTSTWTLRQLIEAARDNGIKRIIVDCAGENLIEASALGAVLKPNKAELFETTGISDPVKAARQLISQGAQAVVVSQGPDGLLLVDRDSVTAAKLPQVLQGNPTGAGDALVAALATAALDDLGVNDTLVRAVAWSAAAVLIDVAGRISDSWPELAAQVVIGHYSEHDQCEQQPDSES